MSAVLDLVGVEPRFIGVSAPLPTTIDEIASRAQGRTHTGRKSTAADSQCLYDAAKIFEKMGTPLSAPRPSACPCQLLNDTKIECLTDRNVADILNFECEVQRAQSTSINGIPMTQVMPRPLPSEEGEGVCSAGAEIEDEEVKPSLLGYFEHADASNELLLRWQYARLRAECNNNP